MNPDINGLDPDDIGLKSIMGVHFIDETKGEKPQSKPQIPQKPRKKESDWMPPPQEPDFYDKLKASAKTALLYGSLNLLLFYFQQTGQMATSASFPCICVCILLMGFGIGRAWR